MIAGLNDSTSASIMKYVPKSKKQAIKACWRDSDGYWIILHEGYNADRTDWNCRTIHEDTIPELRYQIAGISKKGSESDD